METQDVWEEPEPEPGPAPAGDPPEELEEPLPAEESEPPAAEGGLWARVKAGRVPVWALVVICVGLSAIFLTVGALAGRRDPLRTALELRDQGRLDEAITVLEQAAEQGRTDPRLHWYLGKFYLAQNRPLHAQEELLQYLALAPKGPYAPAARLRVQALSGPEGEGAGGAGEAAPPAAASPAGLTAEGIVFLNATWRNAKAAERGGDFAGALTLYNDLVQQLPSYDRLGEVFERMAMCATKLRPPNHALAQEHLARAAREYRRIGDEANAGRSLSLATQESESATVQAKEQEEAARRAATPPPVDPAQIRKELNRQHAQERYRAAMSAWQRQDAGTALVEAQAAAQEDPALAEAHFLLGSIHEAQGNWSAAAKEYQAYAQMRPNDPSAEAVKNQVELLQRRDMVFFADFERDTAGFTEQGSSAADGTVTAPQRAPTGADGSAYSLMVRPGRECVATFAPLGAGTLEVSFYDTGLAGPGALVRLFAESGKSAVVRTTSRAYELRGATDSEQIGRTPGWHRLTFETEERTLTAFLNREFLGVVRTPGPIFGLILAGPADSSAPSYYDQVRVIADLSAASAAPAAPAEAAASPPEPVLRPRSVSGMPPPTTRKR